MTNPPLSQSDALRAYARMMNTGDVAQLEPLLADDFTYESQAVFEPLCGKAEFLAYIRPKLQTMTRKGAPVFAEMGQINAYGGFGPCVVVAQHDKENLVAVVLAKVSGSYIERLDLCVVPSPCLAVRSGEYPGIVVATEAGQAFLNRRSEMLAGKREPVERRPDQSLIDSVMKRFGFTEEEAIEEIKWFGG